ncbi:hypothetical protein ACF0H5_001206 [Mactra antiquata]
MNKLGVGDLEVETAEDQQHIMTLIRAMPKPFTVKKQMRMMNLQIIHKSDSVWLEVRKLLIPTEIQLTQSYTLNVES